MAPFHFSVTQTKHSAGQSAIASAAYRAGEKLYSEYYGEYSDYTRKGSVIYSDILLPSHAPLARALGGEVVQISPYNPHHINPLEVSKDLDKDENPVAMKSELIHSIVEQQMGASIFNGAHKSIIDRCTANVFKAYLKSKGKAPMPLLTDWRNEVLRQPEPEAREIALAAEIITAGSLNVFAHLSNVDVNSRIMVLDLYEMGEQLRPTALVVALDAIQNRVMENRKRGKYTWVFIDEVYLYFKYHYSGEILYRAWKRFRKYVAALTAATQNVEECLKSETALLMFANSEFLLLLDQVVTGEWRRDMDAGAAPQ